MNDLHIIEQNITLKLINNQTIIGKRSLSPIHIDIWRTNMHMNKIRKNSSYQNM